MNYRANGAVARACLNQYTDLVSQHYTNLNHILSQRCSAVNVNMNVSFIKSMPSLIEENVIKIDYIVAIVPAVRQPQLYDLCGSTLNLIFDLSVPYASAVIDPLLNIAAIGNQCPPLKALKSSITRGFTCTVGEVLNMDTNDVPRCCKYYNIEIPTFITLKFIFKQCIARLELMLVRNKRNVLIVLEDIIRTAIDKVRAYHVPQEHTLEMTALRVYTNVFLFVVLAHIHPQV